MITLFVVIRCYLVAVFILDILLKICGVDVVISSILDTGVILGVVALLIHDALSADRLIDTRKYKAYIFAGNDDGQISLDMYGDADDCASLSTKMVLRTYTEAGIIPKDKEKLKEMMEEHDHEEK